MLQKGFIQKVIIFGIIGFVVQYIRKILSGRKGILYEKIG